LRPLIGVEGLGSPFLEGLFEGIETECGIHRVRQVLTL
jgi:hypothetical protein